MQQHRRRFDPETPILGTLASGENVIDRPKSHNHIAEATSEAVAADVIETALFQIDAQGRDFLVEEVACEDRTLHTDCVTTTNDDKIVYAHRLNRQGRTRFVLDRQPEPTDRVTLILLRDQQHLGSMVLIAALPGPKAEPEPWDPRITDEASRVASETFWATHALIWNPEMAAQIIDFSRPFGED